MPGRYFSLCRGSIVNTATQLHNWIYWSWGSVCECGFALRKRRSDTLCICNLCRVTRPGQTGLVKSKLQPHGSWPLSDSPRHVPKVGVGLLSHVVAYLFKTAMSPNKSNSCSFRDSNISIMTSVFCLHNQRGVVVVGGETEDGCCLLWLLCGCCCFGGSEQWSVWWNCLRSEQTALNGNVWFGLGCLWTDGTALQIGKFNKRQSEKMERVRGNGRTRDRTHLYIIPGWFESLRNKGIALDGLNVLYPSHLLLQRSSLWNTCYTEGKLWTKAGTHIWAQAHRVSLPLSCYERHQISFGPGLVDCMFSLCIMLFDTYNMKYIIFLLFTLGLHEKNSC